MSYFSPSYTGRDYDSIKQQLISLVPTLTPNWTDFNESDLGTTIIELLAAFGDLQSYQLDMQALETYLPTVQQIANAQNILKLIGYYMSGFTASVCNASITLASGYPNPVTISAYQQFSTGGTSPIYFATQAPVTFLPLATPAQQTANVSLWQGQVQNFTINYTQIQSDGTYTLTDQNVDVTTMQIIVNGVIWTQVPNVYYQSQSGTIYSMEIVDDYPTITFSPSWQTYINQTSPTVEVTYVTTLGVSGDVGANTITTIVGPIYDSLGLSANSSLTITNTNASSGGAQPETIDQARQNAANSAFQVQSIITIPDYISQTKNYPGVYDATALDASTPGSGITQTLYTEVVVVPSGLGVPSSTFLTGIQNYLQPKALPGMTISVVAPTYETINFTVTAYISQANSLQSQNVQNAITQAIQGLFVPSNASFGSTLRYSIIVSTIQNSSSYISYIEMGTPTGDISVPATNYPVLGTISVTVNIL